MTRLNQNIPKKNNLVGGAIQMAGNQIMDHHNRVSGVGASGQGKLVRGGFHDQQDASLEKEPHYT
jgi:hypothetical protein